ncbi:MAG: N-acetyltransferase [Pseudomonadota bacterium]
MNIELEKPRHRPGVASLYRRALGPARHARAAARLREGNASLPETCFVLIDGGGAVRGSVRCWPVVVGAKWPTTLLGPLAVEEAVRGAGWGVALVEAAVSAAAALGETRMLLVGDAPYYGRAGFEPSVRGALVMPGPVDPGRVLVQALAPHALEGVSGDVRPRGRASPEEATDVTRR